MWHKGVRCHHVEADTLKRRSRGKNILGGERLQNTKYLGPKCYLKQTKSHKHPSIRLFIREQHTLHKSKKPKRGMKLLLYVVYICPVTSSNPQVSAPVPRPVVNGMERMCQRHGSVQPPVLLFQSQNSFVNQFIKYICSRGVFAISDSKLRNRTIVAIEFFATIDWCGIVTAMYRRSMMIYSSPRLNLRGPSVHRYGASIFGDIIVNVSKSINEEKQIFRRL